MYFTCHKKLLKEYYPITAHAPTFDFLTGSYSVESDIINLQFVSNWVFLVLFSLLLAGGLREEKHYGDSRMLLSPASRKSSDNCERNKQNWNQQHGGFKVMKDLNNSRDDTMLWKKWHFLKKTCFSSSSVIISWNIYILSIRWIYGVTENSNESTVITIENMKIVITKKVLNNVIHLQI